ncbi:OmpA family protein [Tellurirhabdus bombi]|uniref:OmpA family protein n=1 Tax=Tellurirhabdus bombi TaxID=2907205 RepID=UPI001F16DDD1|nr:OmpA family protein [Tellurirhabdus bombi]
MRYILLIFLAISLYLPAQSQTVLWANQVVGFSSEGRGETYSQQYHANQILGKPSSLPESVENPCAWSPLYADGPSDEWITVRFDKAIPIQQIAIFESGNPGAIINVLVIDQQGKETSVYKPQANAGSNPLLIFPTTNNLTANTVKVVMRPALVKGLNQIDAIGISSTKEPISIGINVSKEVPKEIVKESLGAQINTKAQEVAPVISPDGKTLYFTRGLHPKNIGDPEHQDIWFSRLDATNNWGPSENIGPPINTVNDDAICGISLDGKTIYILNVYSPDGSVRFGLSKSTRGKSGWSFPVECKIKDNHYLPKNQDDKVLFTEYAIAPDERVIILSVRRRDSIGDKDLYVSFRQADGTYSVPKHMGPVINTAELEAAPFIAADRKSLYFTSAGRPQYGKGDIFVSRRLDETWTKWSEPENLGPSINTSGWDGYFTIPASGDFAYLSSNQNSVGEEDIFRLKLPPTVKPDPVAILSGQVYDALTRKPISAKLVAVGKAAEEDKETTTVNYEPETGDFKFILPVQKSYQLTASQEGYFPTTEVIDLSREKRFRDIKKSIYLTPIKAGQKMVLQEVLFVQSKAELIKGSEEELDRLVETLKQYPQMAILVEGHTDNQGDWNLNLKLSEDRVQAVKSYLIEHGVAQNRVQTKAWGPSKPIASNSTEEKRRLNRRVEFTILKL